MKRGVEPNAPSAVCRATAAPTVKRAMQSLDEQVKVIEVGRSPPHDDQARVLHPFLPQLLCSDATEVIGVLVEAV